MKFMKKLCLLFFLCCCSFTIVFSQNKTADSLKNVLSKSKSDIEKVQLLNEMADYYKSSNPDLMEEYATKALALAQKINYKAEEATALLNLGIVNIISGDYPKALDFFSQAKVVYENELAVNVKDNRKLKNGLARVYGSMGVVFLAVGVIYMITLGKWLMPNRKAQTGFSDTLDLGNYVIEIKVTEEYEQLQEPIFKQKIFADGSLKALQIIREDGRRTRVYPNTAVLVEDTIRITCPQENLEKIQKTKKLPKMFLEIQFH